ncbi:hypothetical protein Y046_5702 [Burkholderia pseudomallei MSHR2990]|nr:hypothetical protein Y046_5702 [Burkholderia pseudomallei MSHR2990]
MLVFNNTCFTLASPGPLSSRRITAQRVRDDLLRRFVARYQYIPKEAFRGGLVASFLKRPVELGIVVVNCSPKHIRLTAQRHRDFV